MNIFRNFAFIVGLLGATAASAGDAASADVFMEPGGMPTPIVQTIKRLILRRDSLFFLCSLAA